MWQTKFGSAVPKNLGVGVGVGMGVGVDFWLSVMVDPGLFGDVRKSNFTWN